MVNFDDITNENHMVHNPNYSYIPDHPYRLLIIRGCGSGKTNALLNLRSHQDRYNISMQNIRMTKNTNY